MEREGEVEATGKREDISDGARPKGRGLPWWHSG